MTIREETKSAFTILKQVMEEKLNETNVEAARVTTDGGFQLIKGAELEEIIKELA
jgi:20S proteasome subunit alpha 5